MFVMLFPGQGVQYIGMLRSFYDNKIFKNTFDEASHCININLWKLMQEGPKKILHTSKYTQPLVLTSSVAIYRLWIHMNGRIPLFMCGHSLGEYSALVCSKAINFSDALKIVFLRGKIMQKIILHRPTSMKVINGLDKKKIQKICLYNQANYIVSLSSFNSIDQIVISGDKEAVEIVSIKCKKAGAISIHDLNINVPAHCKLMKPISKQLEKELKKIHIKKPIIPIINNVDVKSEYMSEKIINALIRQIYSPVRWKEIIDFICSKKIFFMLEIGPNKILTNLNKKNPNIVAFSTNNFKNFITALKNIN